MIRFFPRLPRVVARELAAELCEATNFAAQERAATSHPLASYGPTGGNPVRPEELEELADSIRRIADRMAFPEPIRTRQASSFDGQCAVFLHREAGIPPTEASREDVWAFFGCVLLPDVVRWRWGGGQKSPVDRFLGGDRGLRNTFGRLWWRGELLRDDWWADREPYELVHVLKDDEIVGFVERARAVMSRQTAVAVARETMQAAARDQVDSRMELFRDVMKRFLRRGALINYEALDPEEMRMVARELVAESVKALEGASRRRAAV